MSCCIRLSFDLRQGIPTFERSEDLVSAICSIAEYPVYRVFLTTLLLDLIEERGEHPVILHGFIGDLQTEKLVGLDVDHGMDLDPVAPDSSFLPHPFAPVGDLDSGAVDSNDDIAGEEFWGCLEREIQTLDPKKERV